MNNNYNVCPDILVVVLANNVTIKSEWIDICIKKMIDDMSITAVVPVYEDNDHHPLRAKTVDENGRLQMYGGYIEKRNVKIKWKSGSTTMDIFRK